MRMLRAAKYLFARIVCFRLVPVKVKVLFAYYKNPRFLFFNLTWGKGEGVLVLGNEIKERL